MPLEPNIAATWLYQQLTGSAALTALVGTRISDWPAPQGQASPYVVFQFQTGTPVSVTGGTIIFSDMLFFIRGVAQTRSYGGTLGQIAAAIRDALHLQSGSVAGGVVIGCTREEDRLFPDPDDPGWRHYGALYRLEAQEV